MSKLHRFLLPIAVFGSIALASCAAGTSAAAGRRVTPRQGTVENWAIIQKIDQAALRGEVESLRVHYEAEGRAQPNVALPKVFATWCLLPADAAWNEFKAISTLYPEDPWAHIGMGRGYVTWKMYDLAAKEFAAPLKDDPGFFPSYIGLGELELARGNVAEAKAHFEAALAIVDDGRARAGRGLAIARAGANDGAVDDLRFGLAASPAYPEALRALAQIDEGAGRVDEALKNYGALAALQPRSAAAQKEYGDRLFAAQRREEALEVYERLAKLGNVDVLVLRRIIELATPASNRTLLLRTLRQLATVDKTEVAALERLAALQHEGGDAKAAEKSYREVIERDAANSGAMYALGKLKESDGVLYEAIEWYGRAAQGHGDAAVKAQGELAAWSKSLKLPDPAPKGSVDAIYSRVAGSLNELVKERRKPGSAPGVLKIRVRVNKDGAVQGADVVDDSVRDPWLLAHAVSALRMANYPKQRREPLFEFEVGSAKGMK